MYCKRCGEGRASFKGSGLVRWTAMGQPVLSRFYRQSPSAIAVFDLESGADDHILPRAAVLSCLRSPLPLRSGETSRIQCMVESEEQEEMARTQSLHNDRLANAAAVEPANASQPVANPRNRNCVHRHGLVGHLGVLENPPLSQPQPLPFNELEQTPILGLTLRSHLSASSSRPRISQGEER
jgi:hypothetical protein